MTEEQWRTCTTNPTWMVNAIRDRVCGRSLRLFAVACVRSILPHIREVHRSEVERLVNIAEQYAQGRTTAAELVVVRQETIPWDHEVTAAIETCNPDARFAAVRSAHAAADAVLESWLSAHSVRRRSPEASAARRDELERQTALAKCVFGNPFRPTRMVPAWRTDTVLALVRGIRADWAFDCLPILADALEDAGCDEPELLAHLRGGGTHARACWALELINPDAEHAPEPAT